MCYSACTYSAPCPYSVCERVSLHTGIRLRLRVVLRVCWRVGVYANVNCVCAAERVSVYVCVSVCLFTINPEIKARARYYVFH